METLTRPMAVQLVEFQIDLHHLQIPMTPLHPHSLDPQPSLLGRGCRTKTFLTAHPSLAFHTHIHTHILKLHHTTPHHSNQSIHQSFLRFCTPHIHLRPVRSRVFCAAQPERSSIPWSPECCAHRRASHHHHGSDGFLCHGRRWRGKVWEAGKCRWCAGEQEQAGLSLSFRHSHGHGRHSHSVLLFPWLRQPREL